MATEAPRKNIHICRRLGTEGAKYLCLLANRCPGYYIGIAEGHEYPSFTTF